MARTFSINSELPSRTFTVTQDGESRTFNAYTGLPNVTPANVRAAGALMDDEVTNLAAVKSFDPTAYATAAQGTDERVPTVAGLTSKFSTDKATIVDADKIGIFDSAAADTPKHSLFSLVKSTLKTYFDTLYALAAHTHVSADVTDATDSASVGKIVKFGSQGQVIFACTSATAVTGAAATSGSGGFFSSNTGTGLFASSTSGNHFNAGSGAFIVANNGNVTGTGTFTASNLSGTNTGDQTAIVGITGTTAQFNTALTDGDFATLAGSETLTNKRTTPRITTIVSSGTPTINTDNCDCVTITALAAEITSMTTSLTGTPANFDQLVIRIKDNGTARAITWGASFVARGGILPTTTVISKVWTVLFIYNSVTSTWDCVSSSLEV